jgi:signal transduction histidine kinase
MKPNATATIELEVRPDAMNDTRPLPELPIAARPRILCVDDEPRVLAGLSNVLRRRFDVSIAESGLEALRLIAEQRPFEVVISDARMPGMEGPELLGRVRDVAPETVRILLTGHASLDSAMAAVNVGFAFRFLTKPCAPAVLIEAVDAAVQFGRQRTAERDRLARELDVVSGQLVRAERLATLGTMAGAVGHELNNMLMTFDSSVELVSDAVGAGRSPDPEVISLLQCVRDHVARHGRQLLHLARPDRGDRDQGDFRQAVSATAAMLRSAGALKTAELVVDLPRQPIPVLLGQVPIEQILVNLIKNAIDAVTEVQGRPRVIEVSLALADERTARCTVRDTGCGIRPEHLPSIFEPYFTTKPADRGTGLGLFVVKQIVERAGGRIRVESSSDVGTAFVIDLPLA